MGATNAVANGTGTVAETLDYYPYGGLRIDAKTNYGGQKYKYAGTQYDAGTGLDYAQQRYYNSARGSFISEDPVFLGTQQNLNDPQSLNSYSYANDNPITKSDPSGKCAGPLVAVCIGAGVGFVGGIADQAANDAYTGEYNKRTAGQNAAVYLGSGVKGAVVGAVAAGVAIAAAAVGVEAGLVLRP